MAEQLPGQLWFGTVRGQWPIQVWESEVHAVAWYTDRERGERKQLWRAEVTNVQEYEVVIPEPLLQPKGETDG